MHELTVPQHVQSWSAVKRTCDCFASTDVEISSRPQCEHESGCRGRRLGDGPWLWGSAHLLCNVAGDRVGVNAASPQVFFSACFVLQNDVSEQEQRWGAKTIEGSGHKEPIRWGTRAWRWAIHENEGNANAGQSVCTLSQQEGEVRAEWLSDGKCALIWKMYTQWH